MILTKTQFFDRLVKLGKLPTITDNKGMTFYNIPAGFDIETSSFYRGDEKQAIMYEWTFGIALPNSSGLETVITAGRTWEEFEILLDAVSLWLDLSPTSRRLVVYVHNLPYEWQFIRKRFTWDKVFLIDDRKPVYAICDNGIEFRCSLKLSGKSLANTAKDLTKYKTEKMVGDLDYSKIRHPETPLTDKEWGYCEHDVKVMLSYIQEKIEQDGNITKIPLTKTGYVRRYCKERCFPETEGLYNAYEELEADSKGVSYLERRILRRIYPRKYEAGRDDSSTCWFLRFYEFLSSGYDSREISDVFGDIYRGD